MYRKTIQIDVGALPLRARSLDAQEVSEVLGGCGGNNSGCSFDSDCCDGLTCERVYDLQHGYYNICCPPH